MTTPEAEKMAKEIISKHALSRIGAYSIDVIRKLAAEAYTLGHESGKREMAKEACEVMEPIIDRKSGAMDATWISKIRRAAEFVKKNQNV